ncbi:MAG: transcription termination/antitermination NusG family protein [Gemmatimonadaceae bacterium]
MDLQLNWLLLFTKPRAETWAEINIRRQGFATLLPRVWRGGGFSPLFPRYLFAAYSAGQDTLPLRSTRGIQYVVHCGAEPTRVPAAVIAEIQGRMDSRGVVALDGQERAQDALFAKAERERVRTLEKFARAGFRVVA